MMISAALIAPALLGCVFILTVTWIRRRTSRPRVPPGPKGLPILGNALDLPIEHEWLTYAKWQKIYGDLIYLNVLGQPILIVNSLHIASELMEKRSANYSDRMKMPFCGDLVGWNKGMFLQEGAKHREYRKLSHRGMNVTAVKSYRALEVSNAKKTLTNLLDKPQDFVQHFRAHVASSIMKIAYGYDVKDSSDPLIGLINEVLAEFSDAATPGKYIVDFIPWLKNVPSWLPGFKSLATARIWKQHLESAIDIPYNTVKKQMTTGTAQPSLTALLLDTSGDIPPDSEESLKWAVGSLFAGAADTTVSALETFILAMTLFNDVQREAQRELDAVVGSDRLPSYDDRANLPYLNALIKEVLRWGTVAPLGLPHRLNKEDVYNGYRIPANTLVMPNIWLMDRDTAMYGPDVEIFRPSRFLNDAAAKVSSTLEFGSPAFGFGRRICPGQYIADSTLFILCASTLAAFDITPEMGADGHTIMPTVQYTTGVISHPMPFNCQIKPRSQQAVDLIR